MRAVVYLFPTFLLLFLLQCIAASGQNFNETSLYLKANSRWAFGLNAGLNFNTASPTLFSTAIDAREGPSSVSDPITGNLLFYTNGQACFNAAGTIMPNGDSLLGNSKYSSSNVNATGRSTAQGTCIVPVIGQPNKYYVFSMNGMTNAQPNYTLGSLFYSIVDMNLDSGNGDIVIGTKNTVLYNSVLSEGMVAVPGDNCDIWLIVHAFEMPEFLAFHITANGIDTVPVVSNTGGGPVSFSYAYGFIAVASARDKIAIMGSAAQPLVAQFNPSTGQVSNPVAISMNGNSRPLCFSPDDSKLYIVNANTSIAQFDLTTFNSTAINSSRVDIPLSGTYMLLRLYNDTIYCGKSNATDFIGRINQPNLSGLACDFQPNAIALPAGYNIQQGFGNSVVFANDSDTTALLAFDTLVCPQSNLLLSSSSHMGNWIWSNGSTDSVLSVDQSGTYWVLQNDGCHYHADTFRVAYFDFPEPIITVNVLVLGTVSSYSTYQWLLNGNVISGANQDTYTVSVNGDYQVVVTNEAGCIDTSSIYTVTNAGTSVGSVSDFSAQISIYPNPILDKVYIQTPMPVHLSLIGVDGKEIVRVNHQNYLEMRDVAEGIYFLKVYDLTNRLIKIEKLVKRK